MVRSAAQLVSVREAEPYDRRIAGLHDAQRDSRDDTFAGRFGRRAMRVDAELLTLARLVPEFRDRDETESRMHARVAREARVGRVDATRVRERVPRVDR